MGQAVKVALPCPERAERDGSTSGPESSERGFVVMGDGISGLVQQLERSLSCRASRIALSEGRPQFEAQALEIRSEGTRPSVSTIELPTLGEAVL